MFGPELHYRMCTECLAQIRNKELGVFDLGVNISLLYILP